MKGKTVVKVWNRRREGGGKRETRGTRAEPISLACYCGAALKGPASTKFGKNYHGLMSLWQVARALRMKGKAQTRPGEAEIFVIGRCMLIFYYLFIIVYLQGLAAK